MRVILNFILRIDKIIFRKFLTRSYWLSRRIYLIFKSLILISRFESKFDFKAISYYEKNYDCDLARYCDIYGSDKGELKKEGHPYPWPSHTYTDVYSRLFSYRRNEVNKIFECGIGTNNPNLISSMGASGMPGASLRVWRDYFPNAIVIGADIDNDVLFEENRIKTFYIDQTNPNTIETFWNLLNLSDFDIIIDDGLHTFEAGKILFENSINYLDSNGYYIIEDVQLENSLKFKEYFKDKGYLVDYVHLYRPLTKLNDNCLIIIRKSNKFSNIKH
jgi:hypothetical protein